MTQLVITLLIVAATVAAAIRWVVHTLRGKGSCGCAGKGPCGKASCGCNCNNCTTKLPEVKI